VHSRYTDRSRTRNGAQEGDDRMTYIRKPRPFAPRGDAATPEAMYLDRRRFLETLALGAAGVLASATGVLGAPARPGAPRRPFSLGASTAPSLRASSYPAPRNARFVLDRAITEEKVAARHNNFYEFTEEKERVWEIARTFVARPWTVEVKGLCNKPQVFDIDRLERTMPLEERLYRHRCVETWAMAVPWTGFPLRVLLNAVDPKPEATHVRFVSFLRPDQAPNQKRATWYPWPYYEGLTMAEARNELTLLATGIYGHPLPQQHGAPIRLVTPWKYGYKSAKSIVLIELVSKQPPTFWNDVAPAEYGFTSNVNPAIPHPRWSQANEKMIGTGEKRKTVLHNGYGDYVASLYGTK
jgi:sulfoxide reductase catalytic subunit YedY